ncbi:hypothetical protein KBB49_03805 [Candidatus Saccharibacteria bacterium]|nr:hypothetical protein [Candidatus Saccharibacteria bacterium]
MSFETAPVPGLDVQRVAPPHRLRGAFLTVPLFLAAFGDGGNADASNSYVDDVGIATPADIEGLGGQAPKIPANSITKVDVGRSDVTAILNLTATQPSSGGYFQVKLPSDAAGSYSSLNVSSAGQTTASISFARAGSDSEIEIYNQPESHLIGDVQGYFTGGSFDDIPDVRILDTRSASGNVLPAGSMVEISGRPNSTGVINIVGTGARSSGYVQAVPRRDSVLGGYSNLNVSINQTVNRLAFVKYGNDGK